MNTKREFNKFMARPMRSTPEELAEELMQPIYMKNFSRKDKARRKFVMRKRREYKLRYDLKAQMMEEYENYQDIKDGSAKMRKMTYQELIADVNKDMKLLQAMDSPVAVYKDEEARLQEVRKEKE